ncbi:MAG: conditioned medium-induced protein 4 [Halobacteriales archaeon]
MDDKTEELRELFLEVADEETVTEPQRDPRGSLEEPTDVEERLGEVIAEMRATYGFEHDLPDEALVALVRAFYDGASDAEIARRLGIGRKALYRARLELHLVRDRDREAPFDIGAVASDRDGGASIADLADAYDVSPSTIRRYLRVFKADRRSRLANQRFRDAFDSILADADLSTRLTSEVRETGLEDATEGLETNVSF